MKKIAACFGMFKLIFDFFPGFILRNFDLNEDSILLISYPGELFMRILKLIILPLVISSLISCTYLISIKLSCSISPYVKKFVDKHTCFFNPAVFKTALNKSLPPCYVYYHQIMRKKNCTRHTKIWR